MTDRLEDGLERDTSQEFFISNLSEMSETNPFSRTVSIEVVSRPPVSAAEMGPGGKKSGSSGVKQGVTHRVLAYALASMGCVVLVGAALMWRKKKGSKNAVSDSNEAFSLFDRSNKKGTSLSSKIPGIYGADDDTMGYLNSIRKRYKDQGDIERPSLSSYRDENIAATDPMGSYEDCEDEMADGLVEDEC